MIAKPEDKFLELQTHLIQAGLFSHDTNIREHTWRISPEPYFLNKEEVVFFKALGGHLLKFYSVLNRFYLDSAKGRIPRWFAEYLDLGKPPHLQEYGRMNRFKNQLPGVIRPDVIVTENGFTVTELDSIPGGFGLMSRLMPLYKEPDTTLVGEEEGGIPGLMYRMCESTAQNRGCTVAIVVSDEAADYLSEMKYLGNLLKEKGLPVYVVHPRDLTFKEEGLFLEAEGKEIQIEVMYRFFENFDLPNVPKAELFMFSNKKGKIRTTPPYKPFLEEKLSFALFRHPSLAPLWEKELGAETFEILSHLIPDTWILDNRELPPHGVIPGLFIKNRSVRDWEELFSLTQKERELVVKVSGFSEEAWGGRGVTIGHDVSVQDWEAVLRKSLERFPRQPSILQKFQKGKRVRVSYYQPESHELVEMQARVRLTPYYFVVEGEARLGGIMATLCPQDKKKIHGMSDAVIVPCAVERGGDL